MASQRLVRYAEYIDAGMDAKNAAIKAGYADSTAARASVDLTPQAIRAGLLPDPDQRAELVAEFERRLASRLLEVADQLGDRATRGDMAAIREFLDRYLGKANQTVDARVDQVTRIIFEYDDNAAADPED
jgi:hypothetical protein